MGKARRGFAESAAPLTTGRNTRAKSHTCLPHVVSKFLCVEYMYSFPAFCLTLHRLLVGVNLILEVTRPHRGSWPR